MALAHGNEHATDLAAAQAAAPRDRRTSLRAIAATPIAADTPRRLTWLARLLTAWRRYVAERRGLAELNDYYLKDLGLTREDVASDRPPDVRLW